MIKWVEFHQKYDFKMTIKLTQNSGIVHPKNMVFGRYSMHTKHTGLSESLRATGASRLDQLF